MTWLICGVIFRRHYKKMIWITLLLLVVVVVGSILWGGSQIASPGRRSLQTYHCEFLGDPAAHGMKIETFSASDGTPCLVCLPEVSGKLGERGTTIRKQFTARQIALKPLGQSIGNLVLLHGRNGRKEDFLPIAERFCALGFRCIIPDLPAHGENQIPVTCYGAREAELPHRVLDEAAAKYHFEQQPAGLLGMSMGGSFAVHSADLPDAPWKTMVVLCSFDFFPPVIEAQAAQWVGTTLAPFWCKAIDGIYRSKTGIALGQIEPRRHAANIRIPVLIAHGSDDRIVPITAGRRLYDSFSNSSDKKWIEIPGANHNNILVTSYPIYADLGEWMMAHVRE